MNVLILQRTCRHELFTPPVLGNMPQEKGHKFQVFFISVSTVPKNFRAGYIAVIH